jgi:hypothetical protein
MTFEKFGSLIQFDQARRDQRLTGLINPEEFEYYKELNSDLVDEAKDIFANLYGKVGLKGIYPISPSVRQLIDVRSFTEGPRQARIDSLSIHVGRTVNGFIRENLCMITTGEGTAFEHHNDFVVPGRTLKEPNVGDIELVQHWGDVQWDTFRDIGSRALSMRERVPEPSVA